MLFCSLLDFLAVQMCKIHTVLHSFLLALRITIDVICVKCRTICQTAFDGQGVPIVNFFFKKKSNHNVSQTAQIFDV